MLPGLRQPMRIGLLSGAGGGGGGGSLVFFDSSSDGNTSGNDLTVPLPAATAANDIAFLFGFGAASSPVGFATISGWTSIVSDTGAASNLGAVRVYRRTLAGGDSDPVLAFNSAATGHKSAMILVLRPDFTIATVSTNTWTAQVTTSNPSSQTVTALGSSTPCIVFGMAGADAVAAFSVNTPTFDAALTYNGSTYDLAVGYKIYNAMPANHTIDMSDLGGFNALLSGLVRISA